MAEPTIDQISGNVVHPVTPIPNFTADLNNVFSTNNITQATTNPTAAPDDLLNIRNTIYNELGIPNLQKQYQDIYKNVLGFDLGTTAQQQGIEGQAVSMNTIRGEQAQASNQRALQRQGMVAQADVAQSALQAALGEAGTQYTIRANEVTQKRDLILQYPGAKITFGDSMDTVVSKLNKYQKEVEKDAYKKELKKIAIQYGIKTSGKNTKSLEKAISKYNKNALKDAKEERDLSILKIKAEIANIGKKTVDPLDDLRKQQMEQSILESKQGMETSAQALKAAQLEYDYQKKQIDAANEPTIWDYVKGSKLNPLNWF